MFTGLITDEGMIVKVTEQAGGVRLRIACRYPADSIAAGASIACSGICLTVVDCGKLTHNAANGAKNYFEVEAWEEALRLTTIRSWRVGQSVNLERSLKAGDELGGHLVSGHVDGAAEILAVEEEGDARRFRIKAPAHLACFIAAKGSVCLDGVSLTVNAVQGDIFDVLLIRHSLSVTTWKQRQQGDFVNIEIDPLARYLARMAAYRQDLLSGK